MGAKYGISKIGRVARAILFALVLTVAGAAPRAVTTAATPCTGVLLKKGSSGTCVVYAQQLLNSSGKAGSAMLTADGSFGAMTDKAVRVFQTNSSLSADGYVGAQTWNALCAAPYTGRVAPVTTVNSVKKSAGCADSLYIAPPVVQITSPSGTTAVGGAVLVTVSATDADGIASVALKVDGNTVSTATKSPYTFYVDTTVFSIGTHALTAVATDNIGTVSTSASANIITSAVTDDSTAIPCASGTTNLGAYDGYSDGVKVPVRLCAVTNLASSSDESNPNTVYYISGSNGLAIVSSRVSQQVVSMVTAAKAAGYTLSATSAFRTMKHQQDLCNLDTKCLAGDYSFTAQPGYSTHQLGIAIDFAGMYAQGTDMNTCSARAVEPNNTTWLWLYKNGDYYGMKQYTYESWHWDASGLSNRCGNGQGYAYL